MVKINSLVNSISCHCWSPNRDLIAICPDNNEVWIYETFNELDCTKWKKRDVISAHTLKITGIDWSIRNQILTCSEDCTAYVWEYIDSVWTRQQTELNIKTAALCCKWSPNGLKFAIGYSDKDPCICYYQEDLHVWARVTEQTKQHQKDKTDKRARFHRCSVLCLSWHPSNQLLALGFVDGHINVVNAYIPEIDGNPVTCPIPTPANEILFSYMNIFDNESYIEYILFEQNQLLWSCHDATLNIITFIGNQTQKQLLYAPSLPFTCLNLINSTLLIAAGYDCLPYVYSSTNNQWKYVGPLERALSTPPPPPPPRNANRGIETSLNDKLKMFQTQKIEVKRVVDPNEYKTHKNTITCIQSVYTEKNYISHISTSSLDGRINVWDIKKSLTPYREIRL